jgi:hypothetical protein
MHYLQLILEFRRNLVIEIKKFTQSRTHLLDDRYGFMLTSIKLTGMVLVALI